MRLLAIETSCDETAAAVVEDGRRILSNVVSTPGRDPRALRRRGARSWPRATTSRTSCPVVRQAMDGRRPRLRGARRRRRDPGAGPGRLAPRGRPGRQGDRLRARQAARPRPPHRGPHPGAVPRPRRRSRCPPWPSSSRAGTPASSRCPSEGVYRLLGAHPRRRRGRGLRQGREAPGPRLSRRAGHRPAVAGRQRPSAVEFTVARIKDGSADFSFSGIKTAVLLSRAARGHRRRRPTRPALPPRSAISWPRSSARSSRRCCGG